jgi:hypothetical protein
MRLFLTIIIFLFPSLGLSDDSSWSTGFPEWRTFGTDVIEVDYTSYFEVQDEFLAQAISQLESVEFRKLSTEEATKFAGTMYSNPLSYTPFLVRGVYKQRFTGGFYLYLKKGELLVMHSGLGGDVPADKLPVVVVLDTAPTKVYVEATADE